jgi:hypothetical protein
MNTPFNNYTILINPSILNLNPDTFTTTLLFNPATTSSSTHPHSGFLTILFIDIKIDINSPPAKYPPNSYYILVTSKQTLEELNQCILFILHNTTDYLSLKEIFIILSVHGSYLNKRHTTTSYLSGLLTKDIFNSLSHLNKPLNILAFSCYGELLHEHYNILPKHSQLITLSFLYRPQLLPKQRHIDLWPQYISDFYQYSHKYKIKPDYYNFLRSYLITHKGYGNIIITNNSGTINLNPFLHYDFTWYTIPISKDTLFYIYPEYPSFKISSSCNNVLNNKFMQSKTLLEIMPKMMNQYAAQKAKVTFGRIKVTHFSCMCNTCIPIINLIHIHSLIKAPPRPYLQVILKRLQSLSLNITEPRTKESIQYYNKYNSLSHYIEEDDALPLDKWFINTYDQILLISIAITVELTIDPSYKFSKYPQLYTQYNADIRKTLTFIKDDPVFPFVYINNSKLYHYYKYLTHMLIIETFNAQEPRIREDKPEALFLETYNEYLQLKTDCHDWLKKLQDILILTTKYGSIDPAFF